MGNRTQFGSGGIIVWILGACAAFGAAYWLWPEGITDIPVAAMTLHQFGGISGSLVLALVGGGTVAGAVNDANESLH